MHNTELQCVTSIPVRRFAFLTSSPSSNPQPRPRVGTAESRLEAFDEIKETRAFGTQGGVFILSDKDLVPMIGSSKLKYEIEPLDRWEIAGSVNMEHFYSDSEPVQFVCAQLLPFSLYRIRFRAENIVGVRIFKGYNCVLSLQLSTVYLTYYYS